jgi:hypothetical protein
MQQKMGVTMAQRSVRLVAGLVFVAMAFAAAAASADPSATSADAGAKKPYGPSAAQMWRERQHLPYPTARTAKAPQANDAAGHAAQAFDRVVGPSGKKRAPRTAAKIWRERQHLPDVN